MMVIGLSGLARVGKNEVANILTRDYGFEQRSFAAPLKKMLRTLDPILGAYDSDNSCYDPDCCGGPYPCIEEDRLSDALHDGEDALKASEYGDEYRRLLQVLGTDCIRSIDDDFWIKAAKKSLTDPDGKYVFTDCRFPNEAQMIFDMGGFETTSYWGGMDIVGPKDDITDVWLVTRPGVVLKPDAHISEQHAGHMGETVEINNNGSLADLKETVDTAMRFLATPRRWMMGIDPAVDVSGFAGGGATLYEVGADGVLRVQPWGTDR